MNKVFKIVTVFSLLLFGCAGTPTTSLYMLHLDQVDRQAKPAAIRIGIYPFSIVSVYSNPGIAYQHTPYKIQFYHYHKWASDPAKMIGQTIGNYFEQAGNFQLVCQLPSSIEVDYQIRGTVLKFTEWNEETKWFGLLELDIQIIEDNTGHVAWSGQIARKIPAEKRNPISVVKALSEATRQIAAEIAAKIESLHKPVK